MDGLEPGQELAGRYQIVAEIGQGGMATVYRAHDQRQGRDVAVKVLHEDLSMALGPERFRREIHIAGQLAHPNILQIYDSGEAGDLLFCVMPLIVGESLRTRIVRERQMPLDDAVRIGCEVASALDFAHRQGVIHRDVKPENILLSDGHALLADFGIARAMQSVGGERITRSGLTLGTPTYMSPEQGNADTNLDGRSDIYALGCCLYEMLAGVPPFVGPSPQVIIARHTLEQAPPLSVARPGIPEHIEATVLRALAKSPADRFRTADEFAAALSGRVSVSMPRISRASLTARGKASALRWAAAAVLLLVTIAITAWLVRRDRLPAASLHELDPRTIAVQLFEDRTGGRLSHLAEGLTAALIERLSGVPALHPISLNGMRQVPAGLDADSVARLLQAGTVVHGSIEPAGGDNVKVVIRLIEGMSGIAFRQAAFTAPANDPIQLREAVAERAADFLRARLGDEIRFQARRNDTRSGAAWGLLQQADRVKADAEKLAEHDSLDAAQARFTRADSMLAQVERLDPRWTEPIVLRGTIAYQRARLMQDPNQARGWIDQGLSHAEHALAVEPRDAAALELRGTLRYLTWILGLEADPARAAALFRGAESDLQSAVAGAPTRASAWSVLSHLHYQKPDLTEAKLAAQRAYEEDAYLVAAPDIVWRLYTTSYDLEDFSGAAQWCKEGERRFPDNPRFTECRLWLMTARGESPDISRAWALTDTLGTLYSTGDWETLKSEFHMVTAAVIARAAAADSALRSALADSARHVLVRSRLPRELDPEGELLGLEAFVRTLLNDKNEALGLLKQYFTLNPTHRALFARGNVWWWRALRDDPRFGELVGFTDS